MKSRKWDLKPNACQLAPLLALSSSRMSTAIAPEAKEVDLVSGALAEEASELASLVDENRDLREQFKALVGQLDSHTAALEGASGGRENRSPRPPPRRPLNKFSPRGSPRRPVGPPPEEALSPESKAQLRAAESVLRKVQGEVGVRLQQSSWTHEPCALAPRMALRRSHSTTPSPTTTNQEVPTVGLAFAFRAYGPVPPPTLVLVPKAPPQFSFPRPAVSAWFQLMAVHARCRGRLPELGSQGRGLQTRPSK